MSISGVGGPRQVGEPEPDSLPEDAAPSVSAAAPIRGSGAAVPAQGASAVLALDAKTHPTRNVPDKSYGAIVSGEKNGDGSWTVRVGTFPTSIAGPLPGQQSAATDVAAYTFKNGKASAASPAVLGSEDAKLIERAKATFDIYDLLDASEEGLSGPGPASVAPNPDPDNVARFQGFLGQLQKDGKLAALRKAVDGADNATDWIPSEPALAALVAKYGSPAQRVAYNKK